MTARTSELKRAAVAAAASCATSLAALAWLARAEGKGALQPVNATSHWLNGEAAASHSGADLRHTAVGLATHQAATLFWAVIYLRWMRARGSQTTGAMVREAVAVSAFAAIIDYGPTPKRFTPGWEFVLSKSAMAVVYGAMAIGLAAGAAITRPDRAAEHAAT